MKVTITVQEAIMLDAYKAMRVAAKAEGVSQDKKTYICSSLFKKSMEILDKLETN